MGYGLIFDYQSATFNDTYTQTVETGFDPNTGMPTFSTASYTDKFAVTLITIAARVTYHFSAGSNFDPYIGATIGYVTGSFTFSSSNPDGGDLSVSGTGIALGIQAGARYYFSSHIGAFGELAYCTNYGVNLVNVGLTFKI